ncbi:RNA 2'-phosphotransferase [Streptomyces sp. NPDC091272]|uniref:RNA 2'-phosphotransferase n=1 Tax=Streptomyces sp. NPDC091272 TaxID=3365981 RepID=UPI0037FD0BF7
MNEHRATKVSKYLSRHLRHQPERIGLTLDDHGWVEVEALIRATAAHGFHLTRAELDHVVADNDKQRFAVRDDDPRRGTLIRASQGHTVAGVDLALPAAEPPEHLFHGTNPRAVTAIRSEGLRPMNRHDVHLSPDRETATRVGARRGRPVVLCVRAGAMHRAGHAFRVSANGVWLTAHVPADFLGFPGA